MPRIFNTVFENEIRIIILLNTCKRQLLVSDIIMIDFMAIYGGEFGVSNVSLNGNNPYMYSEFATRKLAVQDALKDLLRRKYVQTIETDTGLAFCNTQSGDSFCRSLDSQYATEYRNIVKRVIEKVSQSEDESFFSIIEKKIINSLHRENH